eukprot:TRINITY_DN18455_c0_g1_i3.p1 TRINITY_DN18455_c0_g1~~TRINITY_DN18455_c0_g1_i3.p1  ORF type:complete len:513 (+),score=66.41 TRINITY_DN18455_c0_g1_i3:299-1837(+)
MKLSPMEMTDFFDNLRNHLGGTGLEVKITTVTANMHEDLWKCDSGTGSSRAYWEKQMDGWKIVMHEIFFDWQEVEDTVPVAIVDSMLCDFEENYNANEMAKAVCQLYSSTCTLKFQEGAQGSSRRGSMKSRTRADMVDIFKHLRNSRGGINLQFKIVNVDGNESYLTWHCDAGVGTNHATWGKDSEGFWKVTNIETTFIKHAVDDVIQAGVAYELLKAFEDSYNSNNIIRAAAMFSEKCTLTVNGGVESGGLFTGRSSAEVCTFFTSLRNTMGGTNMSLMASQGACNVHEGVWQCDAGNGIYQTSFDKNVNGEWKIISCELSFSPKEQAAPEDVVRAMIKDFEVSYNLNDMEQAVVLYSDSCTVRVNGGVENGGLFTGKEPSEVGTFFHNLRNDTGGTNLKLTISKVAGNVHEASWVCHAFSGSSCAIWAKQPSGDWKITCDDLTFVPNSVSAANAARADVDDADHSSNHAAGAASGVPSQMLSAASAAQDAAHYGLDSDESSSDVSESNIF